MSLGRGAGSPAPGKTFDCNIPARPEGVRSQGFVLRPGDSHMEALLISTGIVALAEFGDKTQLLSFLLAAKFRKPLPIILGILVATLANHAAAGGLGAWLASLLTPMTLRWVLGLSFLAMAVWMLIPDRLEEDAIRLPTFGIFMTTTLAFFMAEMGDKTQIATVALACHYPALIAVILGTTLGMLVANAPAVYFGDRVARMLPLGLVRISTAAVFAALSVATLLGGGADLGF